MKKRGKKMVKNALVKLIDRYREMLTLFTLVSVHNPLTKFHKLLIKEVDNKCCQR